jgi:hypothetical protein
MPVFYILHNLFNELKVNETENGTEHGKRNCKIFMLGSFIYICVYTALMHLKAKYPDWVIVDAYRSAIMYLFIADIMTMAYVYKSYFGRSILYEMGEDDDLTFDYNEETHKYIRSKNKKLIEKSLEILKNSNKATELYTGKSCSICLEDFDLDNDKLVALTCGHIYHTKCKNEIKSKQCPICITDII